jgi:hypothetical protein
MTVYSIPITKKVSIPWIIIGPTIGGVIVVIAIAVLTFRFTKMFSRRRNRDSVLEMRRLSQLVDQPLL